MDGGRDGRESSQGDSKDRTGIERKESMSVGNPLMAVRPFVGL